MDKDEVKKQMALEDFVSDYPKPVGSFEGNMMQRIHSVLSAHKEWLESGFRQGRCADFRDCDLAGVQLQGADLSLAHLEGVCLRGADLSYANLSYADLGYANLPGANRVCLRGADLSYADLSYADLSYANLSGANLEGTILEESSLEGANLSNVSGLLDPVQWMKDNFEQDSLGFVVYKRLGKTNYSLPDYWKIEPGSFLEEVVHPLPTMKCACGVNFGTCKWCLGHYKESNLWQCRIRWVDLVSVVVPYNTCGNARCGRLELIAQIEDKGTEGWDE